MRLCPKGTPKGVSSRTAHAIRVAKTSTFSGSQMQPVVPPLFLLHPDSALRDLLDRAPGRAYYLTPVTGWSALLDALQRASPISPWLLVASTRALT